MFQIRCFCTPTIYHEKEVLPVIIYRGGNIKELATKLNERGIETSYISTTLLYADKKIDQMTYSELNQLSVDSKDDKVLK